MPVACAHLPPACICRVLPIRIRTIAFDPATAKSVKTLVLVLVKTTLRCEKQGAAFNSIHQLEVSLVQSYQKLAQLSNELRGGLDLLQLVLSREEMKRDLLAVCTDAFDQGVYDAVDTSGVARQPATLHLRVGDQGPAVKVKLRLKGTGTFRNAAFGDAVGPGSSGDGDDADASWTSAAPRRHPKPGGRPSLKRDGVVPSGALRSTAARPHIKSGALLAGGVSSGIGGRKLELTKRRSGPAHGAAVGSGPVTHVSGYWHAGIRSDTALGSAFPTFCAGYRGFTLGPWAVPRTVLPHHLDQALLAFEDPLQLAFGLGMRLGVTATPSSLLANARGVINAVLPSRSQIFPMDMDYIVPDLPEGKCSDWALVALTLLL